MSLETMHVCVIALVFIFIARLRFPSGLSIVEVLRNRYGTDLVKNVRKLEIIDYKYHKLQLDLDVLQTCQHSNVIPKFLRFKLANRNLRSSSAYNSFFDFCHVCTPFLNINNKKLNRAKSIQNKKLSNLVLENPNTKL